ncbi:hypothetical protein Pint_31066 [Pistacia integerrima]|uniref:Uncharacterized protein n=1 Tax=Pistacia integerrima TaxID=434235 RepID=A0ACC0XM12_9ROSI|nr:hypothetical protein Pint_31066 [Pistacia integerrima]
MLSSLLKISTLSLSHLSFISNSSKTLASQSLLRRGGGGGGGGGSSACIVHAGEKDAQHGIAQTMMDEAGLLFFFPLTVNCCCICLDFDYAMIIKQPILEENSGFMNYNNENPAKDVKLTRGPTDEEMPEISGSFLTNTAFALLIFTILYNALFYGVIKPAIDGPDDVSEAPPPSMVTESPNAAVLQSLLSVPKDFLQL